MRRCISTDAAPAAIGPYSQGVQVGASLFVSGQLPIDPTRGELVADDIAMQADQALRNVKAIVEAAGFTMADVVKTTCLLADLGDFTSFNAVYATYFPENPPARETYQVAALPLGARVEISVICAREQ